MAPSASCMSLVLPRDSASSGFEKEATLSSQIITGCATSIKWKSLAMERKEDESVPFMKLVLADSLSIQAKATHSG